MSVAGVAVVILNWNNAPDTLECLRSVMASDYPNFRVLVVDNGSSDGSAARIRAAFPDVEVMQLPTNLGYAEGNNAGVRYTLRWRPAYVCVLNNDTLIAASMLRELVQVGEAHPEVGILGPTMYCADPADTLFAVGSFVKWTRGELHHRGMFEPAERYIGLTVPEPVDFIVGCGLLARNEVVGSGDVFHPDYYLNFEDVEWGVRTRARGLQVWHVPQAFMWHKVSATLGRASPANTYYMTRNALLFFWRNSPFYLRWLPISRIVLRTLWVTGAWTLKPGYCGDSFQRKRDANLFALRDFFRGRFGCMGDDVARVCNGH